MVKNFSKNLYVLLVYAFLYAPLFLTIVYSFNSSNSMDSWQGFSTKWYDVLFANKSLLSSAWRSLCLAAVSATTATIVGFVIAMALHSYRFIGQKVVYSFLSVVILSPEILQGVALVFIFVVLGVPLGFTTLLLAHTVLCFPFVTMTILSRLKGFDRRLVEAASDLGCSDVKIVRYIVIPLVMPAVFAGWLMSFTLSLDDVIISFFVSGKSYEILPLKIYSMISTGIQPDINALCAVLFFATFFVVMFSYRLLSSKK